MSEEDRLKLENELLLTKSKAQMINLYLDLQQKVEQLEKENEQLQIQVNTYENPDDLTLFYMWLDEKAKDKIKQLESIRKEAIRYIQNNQLYNFAYDKEELFEITTDKKAKDDLLNILNKGDNNDR